MESDIGTVISEENKNFLDIVDSLIGCISDNGMELLEYREERLEKYKNID